MNTEVNIADIKMFLGDKDLFIIQLQKENALLKEENITMKAELDKLKTPDDSQVERKKTPYKNEK